MYRQIGVAKTWHESLLDCEAGGGTLVSLGSKGVEKEVRGAISASDFWSGKWLVVEIK